MVIWVTGLSGAGKTTLCNALWKLLKPNLPELVSLDGDRIRQAFGEGLGYSEEERVVQIKRIQNLAKMLSDQGLVVLVAALYANSQLLRWNRQNLTDYYEVYLESSLEVLKCRDPKGLYQGASDGSIRNMVGLDIPWNVPEAPDVIINTDNPAEPEAMAKSLVASNPVLVQVLEAR